MKETVKLKEEAFQAWLAQGYPEAAGSFQMAKRGDGISGCRSKNPVVGGVLANCQTTEGETGLIPGCLQWGRRAADPD